ncbi:MAG: hypothetical protein B7Z83_11805, partial [Thiomonas sp. 20-64-5]
MGAQNWPRAADTIVTQTANPAPCLLFTTSHMQLRTVPAREGLLWVQTGFRRLMLQPWAALLMIV